MRYALRLAVIVVLAGVFLAFTHAKTPIALLPCILVLSVGLAWIRLPLVRFAIVIAAPLVLAAITIGSVTFEPVRDALAAVLPDPTFTGRDKIWRFTLEHIEQRPIVGFGFLGGVLGADGIPPSAGRTSSHGMPRPPR